MGARRVRVRSGVPDDVMKIAAASATPLRCRLPRHAAPQHLVLPIGPGASIRQAWRLGCHSDRFAA
jgi:hypothetical protein